MLEKEERRDTVPMLSETKEQLFRKNHPVIRELREIPEIIFDNEISALPSGAIALKDLFGRKQMDAFHVDCLILKKIARQVLSILIAFSKKHIFPGLLSLEDIYVDRNDSQFPVFLIHPEKFQLLDFEQDYEWFPEDERIFGDLKLFDEKSQQVADIRLLYKILVGSSRGNVKVPPKLTQVDYSELFYKTLPEEWQHFFEQGRVCSYETMRKNLEQAIEAEEEFARMAKKQLDEKAKEQSEKKDSIQENCKKERDWAVDAVGENGVPVYCLYLLLRTELENAREISRLLYQLQDEIEIEVSLKKETWYQGFVYGDGVIMVKEFFKYPKGFRCQLMQEIKEYSSGEAIIIGVDLLEKMKREAQRNTMERRIYFLVDGSLKNDQLFQYALGRLEKLKQDGVVMEIRSVRETHCEANQRLSKIVRS